MREHRGEPQEYTVTGNITYSERFKTSNVKYKKTENKENKSAVMKSFYQGHYIGITKC